MSASIGKELLVQLKKATEEKTVLPVLQQLSKTSLTGAGFIKEYHEQLLYLQAFPFSNKIRKAAQNELERITAIIKKAGTALYTGLCGDGIANTELICSYSLTLTSWLAKKFPQSVSLHSSGADAETVRNTLQMLCPFAEFEKTTQGEFSLKQRIAAITGFKKPQAQLHWLLNAFSESKLPGAIKEELFRQLEVFVQWKLDAPQYSRSFLHADTEKLFLQKSFIKKVNSKHVISKKINPPVKLTALKQQQLCDIIKTSLALLSRETDPVTYADEQAVQLFEIGRGFSIALVYVHKEKRLSLDSYVGYMAFKNGVPVSYGGGWMFGQRCKIGVNIYPAFRKGESAWMFCQVLRLYHQFFNVTCFTVNPYQFGKGNTEGLQSGAFWFYYRLGFRPVNDNVNALAKTEWEKLINNKQYRTPLKVLKEFTACTVAMAISEKYTPLFDAPELSAAISRHINQHFSSNRKAALAAGFKKLKNQFGIKAKNETLALVCLLADEKLRLTSTEKKELTGLFKQKQSGNERDFIVSLQKCKGFWKMAGDFKIL